MSTRFLHFSVLISLGLCLTGGLRAAAEGTGEASVSATIVTPMTIAQSGGSMVFGGEALAAAASVSLLPPRLVRGDENSHDVSAEFSITGSPDYAYSVSVPAYVTLVQDDRVITVATQTQTGANGGRLSVLGTASVRVEGAIVATTFSEGASEQARKARQAIAGEDDEDEDTYVPNSLPIIINNN